MSNEPGPPAKTRHLRNWLSFAGGVVALGSLFAFLLLFAIDLFAHNGNPYMGILAYVVAPGFLFLGLGMMGIGVWIQRRHDRRAAPEARPSLLAVDFARPADRRKLIIFIFCSIVFLLCTAIGSYQSYHVSESVQFCGQACHTPKKFNGNLDLTYQHFLADETNTPFAVRLSLKVGGADPERGVVGGIHWHVSQD